MHGNPSGSHHSCLSSTRLGAPQSGKAHIPQPCRLGLGNPPATLGNPWKALPLVRWEHRDRHGPWGFSRSLKTRSQPEPDSGRTPKAQSQPGLCYRSWLALSVMEPGLFSGLFRCASERFSSHATPGLLPSMILGRRLRRASSDRLQPRQAELPKRLKQNDAHSHGQIEAAHAGLSLDRSGAHRNRELLISLG